jgi:four helix bundle protein
MSDIEGLNRLEVYKVAQELAKFTYQNVLNQLPDEEKWGLTSQIRRAVSSIPANIAEGYGRYYYQETIRFCYLARGSLMELMSHIELCESAGFITRDQGLTIDKKAKSTLRLIHGYINYLKQCKRGQNEPGAQVQDEKSKYMVEIDMISDEKVDLIDQSPSTTHHSREEKTN